MQNNDFVEIEYIGKIKESGDVFDLTSEEVAKEKKIYNKDYKYGPVVIVVGARHVIPGVDEQLTKMLVGDKQTFDIPAEKGFGSRNVELIKIFQLSEFQKQRVTPVTGQYLTFQNGVKGKVISVSSGRVKVDFNHPLAGKVLEYELKINRKIDSQQEQADALAIFWLGTKNKPELKIDGKKLELHVPSGLTVPTQLKKALSDDITKFVKDLEVVNFVEAFKKTA